MSHRFQIHENKAGEYVARFLYNNEVIFWTEGYSSKAGARAAIQSILSNGAGAEVIDETDPEFSNINDVQKVIDSTDWTGLGKRVGKNDAIRIRKSARSLLAAIVQSEADAQTKADACKRVEAVILLLEAPNVPWRQVVELLNHPTVTAFLAAVSLIQLILGMTS